MLTYNEYGDKAAPLMMFLHGGGVSSWMWDRQVEFFAHFHCVTVDLPEHGFANDQDMFSIKTSAKKVAHLIEKTANGKSVIVIGFSLGAQILIQMVSNHPNLVDYAIINSALVRPNHFMMRLLSPLIRVTFPLMKNETFAKFQAKELYINEAYFETYYNETSRMKQTSLLRILKENMSFTMPNEFQHVHGRLLVTVGEKEKRVMKQSADDIVKSNPNCTGIMITGVGHGVPLAKPDYFNQMVQQWLNEVMEEQAHTHYKSR